MATDPLEKLVIQLIPTKQEMEELGLLLEKSMRSRITNDRVTGIGLKEKTIRYKRAKGASHPSRKMYFTGALAEGTTFEVEDNGVIKVGYEDKISVNQIGSSEIKRKITLASLAEVHNEGKERNPVREWIVDGDDLFEEDKRIIGNFFNRIFRGK